MIVFLEILTAYLVLLNAFGLLLMGLDKRRAVLRSRRIRERSLLLVAWSGGAAGTYFGMVYFRHKTRHLVFRWSLPVLALVQLGLYVAVFICARGTP